MSKQDPGPRTKNPDSGLNFGKENLTQAQLFLKFEDIWPFIDGHNAWFLCQEEKCASPKKFAEAQRLLEAKLLDEGTKIKKISPLRMVNSIHLCINDEPSKVIVLPGNGGDKVSAHVSLDHLRKMVKDLQFAKNTFELLDANGHKLKDPILDSAQVHLKFKSEILHI